MKQAQAALKMENFETLCRERGIPLTVQRRVILGALVGREDHPTADQVYEAVADRLPGLSRATVYRALETLVEVGVIHRASHLGNAARYDPNTERHHHLTCLKCHKVVDLEEAALDAIRLPGGLQGFEIMDYSVHLQGLCPECRKKTRPLKAKSA
ncbi:MAG TPA: Fur family transcriptional regulator [bacterium]|nr:Fur family transcriptional regulator [bacterium]